MTAAFCAIALYTTWFFTAQQARFATPAALAVTVIAAYGLAQLGSRWRFLSLAVLVTTAYGFAAGPPAGRTGAPGEPTCVQCHIGTLNSGPGSVVIEGVPDAYEPGQQVTLTVRVSHPERRRWGFQLTALDGSNNPAGTFALVNRNLTRIVNGTGNQAARRYVEQTSSGTFNGQLGSASWEVMWTAPATDG